MRWPTNKEEHAYMKLRQLQNRGSCRSSKAESWMFDKLKTTQYKWKRQAQWGYRLFDFWNHRLGIAIETDGNEHNANYDKIRDDYNYGTSGILVLRVANFNEKHADNVVDYINKTKRSWNDRRIALGLKKIKTGGDL